MKIWIVTFFIIWIVEFILFGMQRATLLISRNAGIEWRGGGELLLPRWHQITWLIKISKWALLIVMAIYLDWKYALGLTIGGFILSTLLPIPYSKYKGIFRKRVKQLMVQESNLAIQLERMLNNAPF